jgi:hypothetical protein
MTQLLIILAIAVGISLCIAFLRIAVEETSVKVKEKKGDSNIFSWLFLFPLFNSFSNWIEKLRVWFLSLGNFIVNLIKFILGSAVLLTVGYLLYRIIKAIFF